MMLSDGTPHTPPSPAYVIMQSMSRAGIRQAELARALGVSRPRLNMILKDRLHVTTEIALRLAKVFGTQPQYWLWLRAEFDIFVESQRLANELNDLVCLQGRQDYGADRRLAA